MSVTEFKVSIPVHIIKLLTFTDYFENNFSQLQPHRHFILIICLDT